jgi:tyrosyl-tRNA synthetase
MAGLCKTRSDARRLISQGGGYIKDSIVGSFDQVIGPVDAVNGSILLRAGKKRYVRVVIQ